MAGSFAPWRRHTAALLAAALLGGGCASDPNAYSASPRAETAGGYPLLAVKQQPGHEPPPAAVLLLALSLVVLEAMLHDAARDYTQRHSPPGYYPSPPNQP